MQGESADITEQYLSNVLGAALVEDAGATPPPPALLRRAAGLFVGCCTALIGFLYFTVVGTALGPLLLWPRTRRKTLVVLAGGARQLTAWERRRRSVYFGDRFPARNVPDQRILRYLATRMYVGMLTSIVVGLLVFGAVLAGLLLGGVVRGTLTEVFVLSSGGDGS